MSICFIINLQLYKDSIIGAYTLFRDSIREYLDTGENISSLATRFNISVSALYSWLSNFGIETSPTNILSSMSKSNADLIKEIAELKRALEKSKLETWEAQVDALAHKKLLEHMENKYQISVKKKTNSQ